MVEPKTNVGIMRAGRDVKDESSNNVLRGGTPGTNSLEMRLGSYSTVELSGAAKLDNAESHAKVPVAQRETTEVTGEATRDSTCDSISNDTTFQTQTKQTNLASKERGERSNRIINEEIPVEEFPHRPREDKCNDPDSHEDESRIDRKVEPNGKLMSVGQDVGDVNGNEAKPSITPGSEYLETGLGPGDLEVDGLGNFSTVEWQTEVATENAGVLSAVVPSRQSTSTDGETNRSENGCDKSKQITLIDTRAITRQLHWIMNVEIIIEDIIAKEAHDHPGRSKDRNAMVSGYETICRHSCSNVETVISILRPRVACAAYDLAVADTNFFNWRVTRETQV